MKRPTGTGRNEWIPIQVEDDNCEMEWNDNPPQSPSKAKRPKPSSGWKSLCVKFVCSLLLFIGVVHYFDLSAADLELFLRTGLNQLGLSQFPFAEPVTKCVQKCVERQNHKKGSQRYHDGLAFCSEVCQGKVQLEEQENANPLHPTSSPTEPPTDSVHEISEVTSLNVIERKKSTLVEEHEALLEAHRHLSLWLRADEGITFEQEDEKKVVREWKDSSKFGSQAVFRPTQHTTHTHELFGHENHESKDGEPLLQHEQLTHLPLVKFPCALETEGLTLKDRMTLLFVLSPEKLAYGPAAKGQRFFGHYPEGQFRFFDGAPSFYSKGDKFLQHLEANTDLRSTHGLVLVKYKLDGPNGVWVGLNNDPFYKTSENPVRLSLQSKLTVGGVNGGCGFRGGIGEVVVFDGVLNDEEISEHVAYLNQKWWMDLDNEMKSFEQEHPVISSASSSQEIHSACEIERKKLSAPVELLMEKIPPKLWLRADYGLTIGNTSTVSGWEADVSYSKQFVLFEPTASAVQQSQRGDASVLPRVEIPQSHPCLQYIRFPCSMVTKALRLESPGTFYIVIKSGGKDQGMERVFGNFPNGGFEFDGAKPVFKSKHGFMSFKDQSSSKHSERRPGRHLADEELPFRVLKYRLGLNGVEIGSEEMKFQLVGSSVDAIFSVNKALSIGGTNGGCGEFDGGIGELLYFPKALDDLQDRVVTTYLMKRWVSTEGDVEMKAASEIDVAPRFKHCLDYDEHDSDPLVWEPKARTQYITAAQSSEWSRLVRQAMIEISHSTQQQKKMKIADARGNLRHERRRIFGPPCIQSTQNKETSTLKLRGSEAPVATASTSSGTTSSSKTLSSVGEAASSKRCPRGFSNDILNWKAPNAAPLEVRFQWEEAVEKASASIAKIQTGGDALQSVLRDTAKTLNQLRDQLFSQYCDDEKATNQSRPSSGSRSHMEPCDTSGDVFVWKVPEHADASVKQEWASALAKWQSELGSFTQGGELLEQFLKKMVRELRIQRNKLFSDYCTTKLD